MTLYRTGTAEIVRINVCQLLAFSCGATAWAIWPDRLDWWGFGVVSVLLGFGAFSFLIQALKSMAAVYAKAKALADYRARGGDPKSSRMASNEDLKKSGMIQ